MTGLAIALVLGAALIHASWNYLLKKSGGGIGFVWAFAALSSLLYAPVAVGVVIVQHFELTAQALAFIFASSILHRLLPAARPGLPARRSLGRVPARPRD